MTRTLHDYAAEQVDTIIAQHGDVIAKYGPPGDGRDQMIERWTRRLVSSGGVPDDILEAMLEISRHNEPQISPQEYECGCVAITRITDREYRQGDKPFEMRLALPCNGAHCELAHLREGTSK